MNQPNHIDELFHERLYNAQVPPPAFVWPNVEAALRRKRRRLIFWWCFAGLGFIAAGALAWPHFQATPPVIASLATTAAQPAASGASHSAASSETLATATTDQIAVAPTATAQEPASTVVAPRKLATPARKQSPEATATTVDAPEPAATASSELPAGNAVRPFEALAQHDPSLLLLKNRPIKPATVRIPKLSSKKKDKNCYDFIDHPNVWLLDAYGGLSFPQQSLTATDPEYQDYLGLRKSSEHNNRSFNAGVRASLLLNRHILLRSGLHYTQMTQVFEHTDPLYVETNITIRQQLVNGVWTTYTDTVVSYGEHFQKVYNRFGMLDIPLTAGMEWRSGRTGFSLQGGAAVNILFWKRGTILGPDSNPVSFSPADQGLAVYKARLGLSLTGSAQWFYHIRPRLRIYAEPYYQQILQPVTLGNYPLQQRLGFAGFRVGLTKIID